MVQRLNSSSALSFSPLLFSTLSRLLRTGNNYQAQELGHDAMRLVIGLLPFTAMVAGAAPDIVHLIFGPTFLPAAPLLAMKLLSIGCLIPLAFLVLGEFSTKEIAWARALLHR